jgi:DNA-binding NtrC family response regulator
MGNTKTRILIVDDNQGVSSTLQIMLEDEGYEVMVAKDGKEGYSAYLLFEPGLIITDIQMPIKSGIELMQLIRHHDPGAKAIYMSGDPGAYKSALEEEKTRYHACFLSKPFSKNELIRSIAKV